MTITALPTPPTRSDPTNFPSRADAFLAALPTLATEINTTADTINTLATSLSLGQVSTSVSSVTIGTGTLVFTVGTGLGFVAGQVVKAAVTASPSTNYVTGVVASYVTGTGVLTITVPTGYTNGSGTFAAWTISQSTLAVRTDSVNVFTARNEYLTVGFTAPTAIATTTGAINVDWTTGNAQTQNEPSGTITYTFTAPVKPCHLQLLIKSDGTSTAQAITWPATVKWLGMQWTAVNNKNAVINFWFDGTNYWAQGANEA